MKEILKQRFNSIELDTNEVIIFNMANWPTDENGNPVSKHGVLWDGSKVVLKTQAQLDSENALKQLPETDSKMIRKIDELYNVLITKGILSKEDFSEYFGNDIKEREVLREKL